jgi:hypothetical protein
VSKTEMPNPPEKSFKFKFAASSQKITGFFGKKNYEKVKKS